MRIGAGRPLRVKRLGGDMRISAGRPLRVGERRTRVAHMQPRVGERDILPVRRIVHEIDRDRSRLRAVVADRQGSLHVVAAVVESAPRRNPQHARPVADDVRRHDEDVAVGNLRGRHLDHARRFGLGCSENAVERAIGKIGTSKTVQVVRWSCRHARAPGERKAHVVVDVVRAAHVPLEARRGGNANERRRHGTSVRAKV